MTHIIVKITSDDDGTIIDNPVWHLYEADGGGHHALCTGEFLGGGESACVYDTKEVTRGGITCEACIKIINRHKSIRL